MCGVWCGVWGVVSGVRCVICDVCDVCLPVQVRARLAECCRLVQRELWLVCRRET